MNKPDSKAYEEILKRLCVKPSEAVFLDDIGMNLKSAKSLGMETIKVTATPYTCHTHSIHMPHPFNYYR